MDDKMRKECMKSIRFAVLFCGILIGSIVFIFLKMNSSDILDQGLVQFNITNTMNIVDFKISLYILNRRFVSMLLLVLMAKWLTVSVTDIGVHLIFGLYYGFVASNLFCRSFFYGWLYSFFCFFPHYFFYLFAFWKICRFLTCEKCKSNKSSVKKIKYFFSIFVIIFYVGLGGFWEIYVQKNILNFFYQHLV